MVDLRLRDLPLLGHHHFRFFSRLYLGFGLCLALLLPLPRLLDQRPLVGSGKDTLQSGQKEHTVMILSDRKRTCPAKALHLEDVLYTVKESFFSPPLTV